MSKRKLQGIALIETLVSLTIVVGAIIAPMTLIMNSAKFARYGIERIQATYIANDGVEMIINFRKSIDIFCAYNPNHWGGKCSYGPGGDVSSSGFKVFMDEIKDANNNGVITCTKENPCMYDKDSFIVITPTNPFDTGGATNFINKTGCGFLKDDTISQTFNCDRGANSVFYRYMYADWVDYNDKVSDPTDINSPAGILITNVVCFERTATQCLDQTDNTNKVIIKSYVSK